MSNQHFGLILGGACHVVQQGVHDLEKGFGGLNPSTPFAS
jgi:hypothetical protein